MSQKGYYRHTPYQETAGERVYSCFINGGLVGTKRLRVKPLCSSDILVKYLNENGQFRFIAFNRFYEINETGKQIGSSNRLITNISSGFGAKKNIGVTNTRSLSLTNDEVLADELPIFAQLLTSPQTYIMLNNKWIECEVKQKKTIIREKKKNISTLTIEIELPDRYTITKL